MAFTEKQVPPKMKTERKFFLLLILFVQFFNGLCLEDPWCDPELCQNRINVHHIACGNSGAWHSRCAPDAIDIDISKLKDFILEEHNKRRNLVASGKLPGYFSAAAMATMAWDEELQFLAELNVRRCEVEHDDCNHTKRYHNVGQNLCGMARIKQDPEDIKNVIEEAVSGWFDEYNITDNSLVKAFEITKMFEKYGHFAEFILDRSTHVGCAIIRYTKPDDPYFHIYNVACNYASIYMLGAHLNEEGKPGSNCTTGTNPRFPALCSEKEKFKPNWD